MNTTDSSWLKTLEFRHTAPKPLIHAAGKGNVTAFATALHNTYEVQGRLGKREKTRLRASLSRLWTAAYPAAPQESLSHVLFESELSSEELSQQIETAITLAGSRVHQEQELIAAHWLLRLADRHVEPTTLVSLFRWTRTATRDWLSKIQSEFPEQANPESACDAFPFLELLTLDALICPEEKGSRKALQQAVKGWRLALDSMTDNDGTPHAKWLPGLLPRLCRLAATTRFADVFNVSLWDKKGRTRLEGVQARTALLLSPKQFALHKMAPLDACKIFQEIAEVLHLSARPGLTELLASWSASQPPAIRTRKPSSAAKPALRGKLPQASNQSDWADWACLRSDWKAPVDQFLVRHNDETPFVEALVSNIPLFSGKWKHELSVDGKSIPSTGEWGCCCWFLDRQAAFVELQLKRDDSITVTRQALLLREESVLILADSIRAPGAARIDFKRTLPLIGDWKVEQDTLSREQALTQDDVRVRVFPWTGPQMRLERSNERLSFDKQKMTLKAHTEGPALYTSTLFDWSEKRREEPVDWTRLTVAEDAQFIPPEVAVGDRLRIGKKQWVVYHSHQKPAIPRTVLGLHTLSETVFGRLSVQGELESLVEVEL